MDVAERPGFPADVAGVDAPSGTRVARVMTWNALAGGWPRREALAEVIAESGADIIGLQEVDRRTLDALADRLGMRPLWVETHSGHGWSAGLLSRWPLTPGASHRDIPVRNALLEAVVEAPSATPLRVFVTHLRGEYHAWRGGETLRLREARAVLARVARARTADPATPILLMGDFNSLAPGEALRASRLLLRAARTDAARAAGADLRGLPGVRKILPPQFGALGDTLVRLAAWPPTAWLMDRAAGLYTPREVIATVRASGLVDLGGAHSADRQTDRDARFTCPSDALAGRIDYIFATPALARSLVACAPLPTTIAASDHRPVVAALALG